MISGYGQTGPYSVKPGVQYGRGGALRGAHSHGFSDSDPQLPRIPLADLTAGQYAAQAAVFALLEQELGGTGEGPCIMRSVMFRSVTIRVPDPKGSLDRLSVGERVARGDDGDVGGRQHHLGRFECSLAIGLMRKSTVSVIALAALVSERAMSNVSTSLRTST